MMSQNEKSQAETIEQLADRAATGDWRALLKLFEKSNDSDEVAIMTADLLFEGRNKIRPDAETAFALYYIAALDGDSHSLDVLEDNSDFDRDASYYLGLTKTEVTARPKIEDLVDLGKVFRTQGAELPEREEKRSKKPERKQNRTEMNEEAKKWKDERDRLNAEINVWVQKRDSLNGQIKEILKKASDCRIERDEFNSKVREAKARRDEANAEVLELARSSGGISDRCFPSIRQLKKEHNDLERKLQTMVLKKREEQAIIIRLKELDSLIEEYEADRNGGQSKELKKVREEAEKWHKLVSEYAEKAQAKHEEMKRLYLQADAIREEADAAHAKFIETLDNANEAHKKYIECMKKDKS